MDRSILFVAREPDETLRTFLPIIDELAQRGATSRVLFHHLPGEWARAELTRRDVSWVHVDLPPRDVPTWLRALVPVAGIRALAGEISQLRATRAVARRIIQRERPAALVVIQDTLLLERFLVRWANRLGIPTLVIQWAFNFPQEYYDRLRDLKQGRGVSSARTNGGRRSLGLYRRTLQALDVAFNLVNSYGGGEARTFAVMGPHFEEQYRAQGVTHKQIVVTGHPLHDAAYRQVHEMGERDSARTRALHDIPDDERVVLYATQPFFWRGVLSPDDLRRNITAMSSAVTTLSPAHRLTVKIHPRESIEDYAFCAALVPPVRVIPSAEMVDLIAVADIFISSSSSTVLLAMMLDRPIVTVNFNNVLHFDFFESIGGTLHVRTFDELESALSQIEHDAQAREALALARGNALERLTRFDGHAAERIADLLCPSTHVPNRSVGLSSSVA